jgi:4-hydroxy-tetrahydrodipicolinate synthase
MLSGSIVALITPFRNGKIDYDNVEKLIEFHIKNGTSGIVPCGTTGESATLSHPEHIELIKFTARKVNKRVAVVAGTGSNSTQEAIELAEAAKAAGADAHLSITPYYNKPTQEGLFQHFKAIAENVELPMVLYNVPGRTGVNMLPETVGRLSQVKNIIGIKEATGDLRQITEVMENVKSGFILLSGDDFTNLPILTVGGAGAISVTANIMPGELAGLFTAYNKGDYKNALKIHLDTMPVHRVMFIETSPIPVKTAAYMMGLIDILEFRLPLCPLRPESQQKLKDVLSKKGLIK